MGQMGMIRHFGIGLAALALAALPAHGLVWYEMDAGELLSSAETPVGTGDLSTIYGSLGYPDDVDVYYVNIYDVALFMASTDNPYTYGPLWYSNDTTLYLFDAGGRGVVFNEDVGDYTLGNQLSTITGALVPAPGNYYLALSRYNRDPVDSIDQLIWDVEDPLYYTGEWAPNGPGAANPLADWMGPVWYEWGFDYQLDLGGVRAVPEPGVVTLLAVSLAGLGTLAHFRKRRG